MMNDRLMQPQRGNSGGPGGAFYMYLGMPEAVRRGQQQATDSYMRSKSVMGTSDSARIPQATDPYAGLQTKLPKSPMRLAPLSPQKAAPAPAPAAVVDGRPSLLAGSPPPAADAETNDAFSKLSKFKEMLDMGLITQEDYARNKQAVLGGLITDSSPPAVSERAVQRPRPVEVPVSTGEMSPESPPGPSPIAPSPKLPGINDHKSPKGKTRKKKQLGRDDDIPRIRNISVEKATRLIREKIEGRLEGGPAGLRRAFQYFDADGSGSIDREEMARAMRLKLQLVFDDAMMDKLMDRFDMQGTGLITYQSFCEMVMGSNASDSTSFVAGAEWVQPKILLRMVRESAKDLRISFTHKDPRRTGRVTVNELRAVLSRFNIYLSDLQFKELMDDVGLETNGQIDYMLFLKHFRMQEINDVEKSCVGTISGMSTRKAVQLIRETIERRLEGGPAGLRRAFQFFDEDASGSISHDEFKKALRLKTMLIFEDRLIDQVMAEYDPEGTGEITYGQFCEMVMGSKARDATGMSNSGARGVEKFESMLARKVRECAKSLRTYCQHCDAMGTGTVTDEELLHALQRHDIVMSDKQFSDMLAATGALDPGGIVRWSDWLAYFRKKEIQTTNDEMLGKITGGHGMSAQKAIQLIRDKITRRMKGGPAGLRRAYQEFCDDGSGVITYEMFRRVLAHKLMIDLDDELWDQVMLKFDTGRGKLDYAAFCELVMGSSSEDITSFAASPTRRMDQPAVLPGDARSFEVSVRRRVIDNWKDLKNLFTHLENLPGRDGLTYDEVRRALERVNIDCTDTQFTKLMTEIDADGDGNVTHQEFLSYMKESERKSFKEEAVGVVAPRDVNQCIAMIQSKIQERLEGGPAGLRRAFQYFDADGSGDIDMDELRTALKMKTMLIFDEGTLNSIYRKFTNGRPGEGIKYKEFCEFVMGSKAGDFTSMTDSKVGNFQGLSGAKLIQALQRRVREQWKVIWTSLNHSDPAETGEITNEDLRAMLKRYDMVMTDRQWDWVASQCAVYEEDNSLLDYKQFMALFPPYY